MPESAPTGRFELELGDGPSSTGAENQVEINETALSDAVGEVGFDFDRHAIGERGTPVATTTLDRYADAAGVERIDVLKLDVEGHELSALRRRLRAARPSAKPPTRSRDRTGKDAGLLRRRPCEVRHDGTV